MNARAIAPPSRRRPARTFRAWFVLAVALCSLSAQAGWKAPREALDRRYVSGFFNIYYTLTGENAFPAASATANPTLADAYARGLAQQLADATAFYQATLGLRHPFAGRRYATAQSIDVHIMYLGSTKGSTGDEMNDFAYDYFPANPAALAIALTNAWVPGKLTPSHELMHIYQNSYTFFKNPWFTEGMARAAEGFFNGDATPAQGDTLPQTSFELDELLLQTYDAAAFWNRLMALCGRTILQPALANFSRLDRQAALARDLDPTGWSEEEQWATANNAYLLKGLAEALQQDCPVRESAAERAELRQFLAVVKPVTQGLVTSQSPGLTDYAGFASRIAQMGGTSALKPDGRIQVGLDGGVYLGWPGWDADACDERGIFSTAAGLWRFGNGQTCQTLYPATADLAAVEAIVAALDATGEVQFEESAYLRIAVNGQLLTLRPAYTLSELPPANANKTYWIESDGRLLVAYPALGKAQAFTLESR